MGRKHVTGIRVWEDNIKITLKETECEDVEAIHVAQGNGYSGWLLCTQS